METALIVGESGAIGMALAEELRRRGVLVTGLSRRADGLDVTDPTAVEHVLGAQEGPFDVVLVTTGALEINGAAPEKRLAAVQAAHMADQFALNAIGPALVLRHAARLLPRQGRSVFAALSARVGSIGDNRLGGWISYRAAKAALNQIIRTSAIELARTHPEATCVALHPGTVRSDLTQKYLGRHDAVTPGEAARNLLGVLAQLGPEHSGAFFDWRGDRVPW